MTSSYPRNTYTQYATCGKFRCGLHGGMTVIGNVRTYRLNGQAIIDAVGRMSAVMIDILDTPLPQPNKRRKATLAQDGGRFQMTLAPRYRPADVDEGYDLPPDIKRTPVRPQELGSDVKVPLAQSVISGGFATALTAIGLAAVDGICTDIFPHELWGMIRWYHHIEAGLVIGLTVSWQYWSNLLTLNRALLWAVETATRQDYDGDGIIGEPVTSRRKPRAVPHNTSVGTTYVDLSTNDHDDGFTDAEYTAAAVALLVHGAAVSRRGIQEATAGSPHGVMRLSQSTAGDFANSLHEANMANENALLRSGWDYLYQFIPEYIPVTATPPPHL